MRKRMLGALFVCLGASFILGNTFGSVSGAVEPKQKMCPVMLGRPVKEKFFVDYNGKRIYLCCAPCVKAFKKNPEKYLKNLKDS